MKPPSGALAASVVISLTVVLGGCGNGAQPTDSAAAGTPSAPTTPAASPTAAGAAADNLTVASFVPATRKAMANLSVIRMSVRMNTGSQPATTMTGVVKPGGKGAMSMVINDPSMGGGQSKLVFVNNLLYMSMPGLTPKGKYVKVDPKDSDPLALALRDMAGEMNPNSTFAAFQAGLTKVSFVKRETVGKEQMAHYRLTVNARNALKAQGKAVPKGIPATFDYDVWLDSHNMMRKVMFEAGDVKSLTTVTPGGDASTIKAPAASDIVPRNAGS